MSTVRREVVAAAALLLLGGAAAAQEHPRDTPRGLVEVHDSDRHGFWGALGVGAGGEAFDLRDGLGYSSDLYRPTISLRLGGTPSRYLRLGGELSAWIDDHGDRTESLSNLLFVGQLYPAVSTGLYLKGGLGLARNEVDFDQGFGVGDTGFAGSIGAGWEVRVGKNWFINPAVDLSQQRYTGRGGDRYRERILNFGVNLLFQSRR
jgi:Outer membrane protein beta-barrel domain